MYVLKIILLEKSRIQNKLDIFSSIFESLGSIESNRVIDYPTFMKL